MCGLSGVIVSKPELITLDFARTMFSLLMRENDDRGGHSWGAWGSGIAPIRRVGKFYTKAEDMHDHFVDMKFSEEGPTFLFGHTRFATHGEKNELNAHPFENGNIILAHNGVVDVDGYGDKDHAVDSGRIAQAIVDKGWVGGMSKVSGSCALLVTVNGSPMLYRHNQILHYCEFPWGIAVSSTEADLSIVLRKNMGLHYEDIKKVPEDTFCQPGFGAIELSAPGAVSKYIANPNAWRGHQPSWDDGDGWWERENEWSTGWGSRSTTGLDTVTGPPSKGALELQKIDKKITKLDSDDPFTDICEFCGYESHIRDLYCVVTSYCDEDAVMCTDCIVEEFTRGIAITVKGGVGDFAPSNTLTGEINV